MRLLILILLFPVTITAQFRPDTIVNGKGYQFLDAMVLAGQSNSGVQNSRVDSLATRYKLRQEGVYLWRQDLGKTVAYHAGGGRVDYLLGSDYDYALIFGRNYYEDTGRPLLVVKHSVGATKLGSRQIVGGDTWDPSEPNDLYQELMTKWEAAKAYYLARGYFIRPVVVIWAQGEADASVQGLADVYAANIAAFIPQLNNDIGFSGTWIITLLRANTTRCCEAQVRTGIQASITAGGHIEIDLDLYPNPGAGDDTHVGEVADDIAESMYEKWKLR